MTEILSKTALANNKKYIGKVIEVLVDGDIAHSTQRYSGHTRTQKKVIFHSNKKIPVESFQKVRIIKVKTFGLEGEVL